MRGGGVVVGDEFVQLHINGGQRRGIGSEIPKGGMDVSRHVGDPLVFGRSRVHALSGGFQSTGDSIPAGKGDIPVVVIGGGRLIFPRIVAHATESLEVRLPRAIVLGAHQGQKIPWHARSPMPKGDFDRALVETLHFGDCGSRWQVESTVSFTTAVTRVIALFGGRGLTGGIACDDSEFGVQGRRGGEREQDCDINDRSHGGLALPTGFTVAGAGRFLSCLVRPWPTRLPCRQADSHGEQNKFHYRSG